MKNYKIIYSTGDYAKDSNGSDLFFSDKEQAEKKAIQLSKSACYEIERELIIDVMDDDSTICRFESFEEVEKRIGESFGLYLVGHDDNFENGHIDWVAKVEEEE